MNKTNGTHIIQDNMGSDILLKKISVPSYDGKVQLIVSESQEALLIRNGLALDLFRSGKYSLSEGIKKKDVVRQEIYIVNKAQHIALKWGTPDKISVMDKDGSTTFEISARGIFGFKIEDTRKFVLKFTGNEQEINRTHCMASSSHPLGVYFKNIIQMNVSGHFINAINSHRVSFTDIESTKGQLSDELLQRLTPYFEEYGMELVQFIIGNIMVNGKSEEPKEDMWRCPVCGQKSTGNYCSGCGAFRSY